MLHRLAHRGCVKLYVVTIEDGHWVSVVRSTTAVYLVLVVVWSSSERMANWVLPFCRPAVVVWSYVSSTENIFTRYQFVLQTATANAFSYLSSQEGMDAGLISFPWGLLCIVVVCRYMSSHEKMFTAQYVLNCLDVCIVPGWAHQLQTSPPSMTAELLIKLVIPSMLTIDASAYMTPADTWTKHEREKFNHTRAQHGFAARVQNDATISR